MIDPTITKINIISDSKLSIDEIENIYEPNYTPSSKIETLSKKILDNMITSFTIVVLNKELNK